MVLLAQILREENTNVKVHLGSILKTLNPSTTNMIYYNTVHWIHTPFLEAKFWCPFIITIDLIILFKILLVDSHFTVSLDIFKIWLLICY